MEGKRRYLEQVNLNEKTDNGMQGGQHVGIDPLWCRRGNVREDGASMTWSMGVSVAAIGKRGDRRLGRGRRKGSDGVECGGDGDGGR